MTSAEVADISSGVEVVVSIPFRLSTQCSLLLFFKSLLTPQKSQVRRGKAKPCYQW